MEIYKYILLVLGGYIAICRLFKNSPICIKKIFGGQVSIILDYVIPFGFLFWLFSELHTRFFSEKEGWMSISDIIKSATEDADIDASLIPSDVKDIPDVPCPERKALSPAENKLLGELEKIEPSKISQVDQSRLDRLKGEVRRFEERQKNTKKIGKTTGSEANPSTGQCRGQFEDIPNDHYGFIVRTKDKNLNDAVTNEQKMRPLESVASDCKLMKSPEGKLTVERSVEPISSSSDSKICVNRVNLLKSQKGKRQYDPNDMSEIRNKELTPNEKEKKQTKFNVDINLVNPKPVYYEPGSYTFGASTYIPNYEQSVYLSKTTGLSQTAPLSLTPNNTGGFCSAMQNDKIGLDKKCQSLDPDVCPSTNCCVLLGGEKCFAGDETGPANKSAFSTKTVVNRDYYYYKSKCYGNCP
jgi:hypothetical protein